MARSVFTIVTPIKFGSVQPLKDRLAEIQVSRGDNDILCFDPVTFPELHFASFVIFEDEAKGDLLVFENSVDGSETDYIARLATHQGIDTIYSHCVGYGHARTETQRAEYLTAHYKKPELRHVSTFYRTAPSIRADSAIRDLLDGYVDAQPPSVLLQCLDRPAQGVREYWTWETIKPFVAFAAAIVLAVVEGLLLSAALRLDPWPKRLILVDVSIIAILGISGLVQMWHTSLLDLRKRVNPWVTAALFAVVIGVVARVFGLENPLAVGTLVGAFLLWIAVRARATAERLKTERIATLRVGSANVSPMPFWFDLQRLNGQYASQSPGILKRLRNWGWWALVLGTTLAAAFVLVPSRDHYPPLLIAALVVAFFLEAVWVTVLVGWPKASRWSWRSVLFVLSATLFAAIVMASMIALHVYALVFGFLVLVAWFAIQGFVLHSPESELPPPTAAQVATMRAVIELEDREVQNHMTLVANIGSSRGRAISLRIFLWTLQNLFYRSLLPDVWRGKLFGIPTVHSAQWVLLPDGRYLFLSNYDQSFTTYLNDFGMQIPAGIQKIWGQCIGNPGMGDVERFKLFVRYAMVPHQVWYRAYPELSVRQIWNNEAIRAALAEAGPDEEEIFETLRRLGAAPKIVPGILHAAR